MPVFCFYSIFFESAEDAENMFLKILESEGVNDFNVHNGKNCPVLVAIIPGKGVVRYREISSSGPPTIDIDIKGSGIKEIKFLK